MKLWIRMSFVCVLMLMPLVASAQYRDLDTATANLTRGFGSGDVQAIVAGVGDGDQVMLEFPGLVSQRGYFGRDQAALLLDSLFNKVDASGFEKTNVRKVSAQGQYHITARWSISRGGQSEERELYITLRQADDRWVLASVRSAGGN